jgi:hypothetical protein
MPKPNPGKGGTRETEGMIDDEEEVGLWCIYKVFEYNDNPCFLSSRVRHSLFGKCNPNPTPPLATFSR